MLGGLIGGALKGIGGGLLKGGLLKGAGGLLKGGGGEMLKGLAGKGMEIAQGAIENAIQGGGGGPQGAEGAQAPQGGGGAEQPKKKDPIARLADKLEKATTPEQVDQITKKVLERMEKRGKLDPETKKIVEALAQNKKQQLAGGPAPAQQAA